MMIRTVPDGDERDKDVANAIRYAVDNGAQIINMSFGKGVLAVQGRGGRGREVRGLKGVLMVHAAGNDGEDLSKKKSFPTPVYLTGGHPQQLDRGGRVVVEGRRQPRRAVLELRQGRRSTCSRRAWTSCRRCRATATSATAARAWRRRW